MQALTETLELDLAKRTMISLSDAADAVVCRSGALWITQDRDPQDIVLAPGQGFKRVAGVRTIVYALEAARLSVQHRQNGPDRRRARLWPDRAAA